jgi:hypothetical protein
MVVAAVVTFMALAATTATAALPAPPFDFSLSPSSVVEGEPVTIRITPRSAAPGAHDLYVVHARSEEASFLDPNGAWAPRPVLYARVGDGPVAPIVRPWPKAWPPGEHALALVVVPVSGDPLARLGWRYRPVERRVTIAPRVSGDAPPDVMTMTVLAALTLAAIGAVWWTVLASDSRSETAGAGTSTASVSVDGGDGVA